MGTIDRSHAKLLAAVNYCHFAYWKDINESATKMIKIKHKKTILKECWIDNDGIPTNIAIVRGIIDGRKQNKNKNELGKLHVPVIV